MNACCRRCGAPMMALPLLAVLIAWAPSTVAAEPTKSSADLDHASELTTPPGYREVVNEAIREYNAHHYEEARSLFHRAHTLFPNARTWRGLGATEFELRNYGESVRCLEQSLASEVRPLDPELKTRTKQLLERARGFVAYLQLTVQPASSLAVVDGVPVADARELVLDVGDHTIEFRAPGYLPERRRLRVNGGESRDMTVVLTLRIDVATSEPSHAKRPLYKSPWLWTGVGLVVAGSATAMALALAPRDPRYDGGSTDRVVGK